MKSRSLYYFVVVALVLFSCKKEEIMPSSPDHFVFTDPNRNLTMELSWTVDGAPEGFRNLNCDLYLSDTAVLTQSKFLLYTSASYANDWAGSPVFMSSIGESNSSEKIALTNFYLEDDMSPKRVYLGVAVNGLGTNGQTLPSVVKINYQIKVRKTNTGEERIIDGSFDYNTSSINKTYVRYVYSVDWGTYKYYNYSFRKLPQPIQILRNSDYVYVNDITLTMGYYYPRLKTELVWNVAGQEPGYSYVDLDLHLWDNSAAAEDISSQSSTGYEWIRQKLVTNYSYTAAVSYYDDVTAFSRPATINAKCIVYHWMNPFKRYVYTTSFDTPTIMPSHTTTYDILKIDQVGNKLVFTPI